MRFLSSTELPDKPKVLIVQTANPNLTDHIIDALISEFGQDRVALFRQKGMAPYMIKRDGFQIIQNEKGGRLKTARNLKNDLFDIVCFANTDEPGFWKMRLLPFYCNPKSIYIYDRFGKRKEISKREVLSFLSETIVNPGRISGFSVARILAAPFIFSVFGLKYFYAKRRLDKGK